MPGLSWNEIHQRAVLFARDWSSAAREQADKQTFWNEFFLVFGIPRRTVASFEEPVRRLRGTYGFIDLLWKGKLLVEHKTTCASLEAAETQAFEYVQDLQTVGRGDETHPRYLICESPPDSGIDAISTSIGRVGRWVIRSVFPTVQISVRSSRTSYRRFDDSEVDGMVRKMQRTTQAVEEGLGHALNPDMQFVIARWNAAEQD